MNQPKQIGKFFRGYGPPPQIKNKASDAGSEMAGTRATLEIKALAVVGNF